MEHERRVRCVSQHAAVRVYASPLDAYAPRSIVIAIILCPPGKKTAQFPMSCNETEPPHFNSKLWAMQRTFQGNIAAQLEFD